MILKHPSMMPCIISEILVIFEFLTKNINGKVSPAFVAHAIFSNFLASNYYFPHQRLQRQ